MSIIPFFCSPSLHVAHGLSVLRSAIAMDGCGGDGCGGGGGGDNDGGGGYHDPGGGHHDICKKREDICD